MPKVRADVRMVDQGLVESRAKAQRLILAGLVRRSADHVIRNAAEKVPDDVDLILEEKDPYVSRGAGKLLPALDAHLSRLDGLIVLDVGASTGGFTDLALQRGASKVYAVDSGHGQLHLRLREDPRVVNLERTNARYLGKNQIPEPVNVVTIDVSFISVTKILPVLPPLMAPGAFAFILVKPQFEAARGETVKGVVKDEAVRERTVSEVLSACTALGWRRLSTIPSPVVGPKGNQEFLVTCRQD